MKMFYGIVEDRNDPLKIGRVRVRVHGLHTDDKQMIATPDLSWSQVILPTTSAGLSGFGTQHGLVEGSTVIGYFRDENVQQDFVVTGSVAGIPAQGYKESITDELIKREVIKGFNDPRRLTSADYADTPDGASPAQSPNRTFGLEKGLDEFPKKPKEIEINLVDGTGSTITELELTETDLPYYPLYYDKTDVSQSATGDKDYTSRDISAVNSKPDTPMGMIPSVAAPIYPFNKTIETESGHLIEIDDTPTLERLAIEHRSGTFQEIHPDGSVVQRIVNDNYQVIAKDDKLYIAGNADITVEKGNVTINVNTGNVSTTVLKGNVDTKVMEGNVDLYVKGNVSEVIDGNVDAQIGGTLNADVVGNTTFTSPTTKMTTNLTVDGTVHITGAQTNDSTIDAVGDISTDAGNGPTLATHKHKATSQDTGSGSNAGKKKNTSVPDA